MTRGHLAIAAVALALGGCAAGGSPAAGSASLNPSPIDAEQLVEGIDATLPAGTYTHEAFEPRITFDLDAGWVGTHLNPDFFDVQVDPDTPDVVAVQFARPTVIHTSIIQTDETAGAAEAAASLAANGTLEATEPEATVVDGRPGVRITVTARLNAQTPILAVEVGTLSILAGRRLELTFVDLPDGLLAIMVGGSVADWDRAMTLSEPVLASVRIGP